MASTGDGAGRLTGAMVALLLVVSAGAILGSIFAQGFLPDDDALFYAARVIADKTWDQILILAPGQHLEYLRCGWHQVLTVVQNWFALTTEHLVVAAVVFQFSLFFLVPALFLRHAESWTAALFLASVCLPAEMNRFFMGRPMTFSITALAVMLLLLGREPALPGKRTTGACLLLVALGTWIHAPWYFFFLLPGFILAREWRKTAGLAVLIPLGILLGSLFSGHPLEFLGEFFRVYQKIAIKALDPQFLVTELRPLAPGVPVFLAAGLLLFGLHDRGLLTRRDIDNPIVLTGMFGLLAGLQMGRLWLDVGVPALLVWMAWQLDRILSAAGNDSGRFRLLVAAAICLGCVVSFTSDRQDRWTRRTRDLFLSAADPVHREWLPEPGGIIYSPYMEIFYDTFYANPTADWKYMLGYDNTLMPLADQEIKAAMLLKRDRPDLPQTFLPWIRKMTPADRFVVKGLVFDGPFLGLEWKYLGRHLSVGRLAR